MQIYTIIGGVNGAGKSSLTGSLRAERTDLGIVVDPDQLTAQCGGDEYEGGKLAVQRIETALADGVNFTQKRPSPAATPSGCAAVPSRPVTLYACIMWAWTLPRKACAASKTASSAAAMTSRPRMYRHGLHTALPMWRRFCPIAMRLNFLITTTALRW